MGYVLITWGLSIMLVGCIVGWLGYRLLTDEDFFLE
jgi:hypothetical protein